MINVSYNLNSFTFTHCNCLHGDEKLFEISVYLGNTSILWTGTDKNNVLKSVL